MINRLGHAIFVIACLSAANLFAAGKGVIKGVVKDKATGTAALFPAQISATSSSQPGVASVITDGNATFELLDLNPGSYNVTAETADGAKSTLSNIVVSEDQSITIEFTLEGKAEVVTVVGLRSAITSSVDKKRESSSIIEAVSAEDIGKLPDASIAESIARLPGLAAQRLDGRANVISIRGLAPDFTTTTLNGREQVSVNNGRAVEYDQYPSELINGVTIYKTPDAQLTAQAIGGTVDMQTIRPLQFGKRALAFNLRGEANDLGALNSGTSAFGYRTSASYIDQYLDDQLGLAIGYARMLSPTQEERWNTWGYPQLPSGDLTLGGAKPYVKSNSLSRHGVLAVVEYAPHKTNFRTSLDAYYSHFSDEQTLRGIEFGLFWNPPSYDNAPINQVVNNGLVTQGTYNNIEAVVRNDFVDRKANTVAIGWNAAWEIENQWNFDLDVSFSRVERAERNTEIYAGTGRGEGVGAQDNLGFVIDENGKAVFTHQLNYADPNLIKLGGPLNWGWGLMEGGIRSSPDAQDGFVNAPETDDDLWAAKFSAKQIIGSFLPSIDYGVRYSKRTKTLRDNGFFLTLKQYPADVPVPEQYLLDPTSLAFIGMGNVLSFDARALYDSGAYILTDEKRIYTSKITGSWKVTEYVLNTYAQANIYTSFMTGNAGLQVVYTDQFSDGFAAKSQGDWGNRTVITTPVFEGTSYWDFLPSLNLSFHIDDNNKVRTGIAQVIGRAPMSDMNAGFGFGFDEQAQIYRGGGGNPKLQPFRTWQFDTAYEFYFGKGGYLSAGAFYKLLTSFPFEQTEAFDFKDVIGPLNEVRPGVSTVGIRHFKDNQSGGGIYGLEISASVPFGEIWEPLDGFGILGSASFTGSRVTDPGSDTEITFPGLSQNVVNTTAYFEKWGFQIRASMRHRSTFLGEISGFSLNRTLVNVKAETIFDAQAGYDFSEIGATGLSVLFQVNNLSNQPFTTFHNDDVRQVRDFQNYGRTYLFGLNYKL